MSFFNPTRQREETMSEILQIVDGEGCIRADEAKEFVKKSGIDDAGVEYTVVSIMGPQSSGKSTLMNHLVGSQSG